jgi:hypothetical protein
VNASDAVWLFVAAGEGVRLEEFGVTDPDLSATVGVADGPKPQPANTEMLTIAQPKNQTRRQWIA